MAQIELFTDIDCDGTSSGIVDEDLPNLGDFWNDTISSVRIYSGEWMLCSNENSHGLCIVIGPGDHNMNGRVNDVISSLKATVR